MPYSLHLIADQAHLANVKYPKLITEGRFSSASQSAVSHKNGKIFYLTDLASIPDGSYTVGKWQFTVKDRGIRRCQATSEIERED